MNYKYKKYIEYIVNDIDPPYLKSLEPYGLKQDEMELVLSKIFNRTIRFYNEGVLKFADDGSLITISDKRVFNQQGKLIYQEISEGYWQKYEYDDNGNQLYREDAVGCWAKQEYDDQGKIIYYEDSSGFIMYNR